MKTTLRMATLVMMLGLALVLAACGGGGNTSGGGSAAPAPTGPVTIDIAADGENLAFDKTTLTVGAGQQVTLNFDNVSVAQQHNWVLVNGGEDVSSAVATAGLMAGLAAEYLPADRSQIIANTGVLNGGAKETITFTAPGPGTYLYICTVPGHYPLMQGTLIVN
ncbi:MAG: plastocyanin/azurin family copper-binding protein [Oscillochloridaceae bacterium umkhey_bin13]